VSSDFMTNKFSPDEYKTRCGLPWRWLNVKGRTAAAVWDDFEDNDQEEIVRFNEGGFAYLWNTSTPCPDYDLLKIPLKPIPLPLGMNPDLRFARWSSKAKRWQLAYDRKFTFPVYLNPRLWSMDNCSVHKGHVHQRIDIGLKTEFWERI